MASSAAEGNEYIPGPRAADYEDDSVTEADDAAATAEDSERLRAMTQEERDRQRRDWCAELEKTEEEIQTLKQVLNSKIRRANDLKRQLGITVFGELRSDFRTSWQHLKESGTYQRTASAAKGARVLTSELSHTVANKVSAKWSSVRNSNTFKSLGGRMGSAYSSVKVRMSGGSAGDSGGGGGGGGSGNSGPSADAERQQRERLRQLAEGLGGVAGEDPEEAAPAADKHAPPSA